MSVPVDPTLAAAAIVAFAVIAYTLRGGRFTRSVYVALALWATFVPGLMLSWPKGQGIQKNMMLFSFTLLIAVSSPLILRTELARKYWMFGVVGFALLIFVLALAVPSIASADSGRLNLEGGTTIVVAQLIGAGCVTTLTAALRPGQKSRQGLMGLSVVFAFGVLLIGSRGPFLAMLLALTLALTFGRIYARSRAFTVGFWVLLVSGVMWFIFNTELRSASRIAGFFAGVQDPFREMLYRTAWESIANRPQGVGWGGFTNLISNSVGMNLDSSGNLITVYPHNLFLEIAVEGGWLAALAVVIFVSTALIRLWRRSIQPEGAILFGLAIYWLMAAQTSSDINGNRMMWASLMVAFAVEKVKDGPSAASPELLT